MFERLIEKTDLKKYNFDDHAHNVLNDFLLKDEFVEILASKYSLLGIKQHHGKEIIYSQDEKIANEIRLLRDEFWHWSKFYEIPFKSERHLNIHLNKNVMADHIKHKIGNIAFDKTSVEKKLNSLNQKLQKVHDRLQGVYIINTDLKELLSGFDSINTVFATKIPSSHIDVKSLEWIDGVKRANLFIICPDSQFMQDYLLKKNCEKLKVGRTKNKNIWIRKA